MNTQFMELSAEEMLQTDGGGWLSDLLDTAEKASKNTLLRGVAVIEPIWDFSKGLTSGIADGWNKR
ncbi:MULTISPECIES: hypothetical protein [unclassified Paenibacillus]|uniref:hypothetical protein n=1 Tax=Paenibacillus TaxID=44249 RepID=UPI00285A6181|nr:hypothetical protein [Paenibacillus sp. 2003]MDR6719295.1 hypothetical protein [Paenibacillus sp. 2003]